MVDFHGEYGHGHYYKASTYDDIAEPKKNPMTRERISPRNLTYYKARLIDERPNASISRKRRTRRTRSHSPKRRESRRRSRSRGGGRRSTRRRSLK